MLEDGTYDVVVVDAERPDQSAESDPTAPARLDLVVLDLAVLAGPHKGEMVRVTASGLDRDPLDLLAIPGVLLVADGEPKVELEG